MSTRYHADALVVFHHINAYEEDDNLVFDLITYTDGHLYEMFYIKNVVQDAENFVQENKNSSRPICQRFVVPLNVHKVSKV